MKLTRKSIISRTPTCRPREPLKSTTEIAEMLGITTHQLAAYMGSHPAPDANLAFHSNAHRNRIRYYAPSLMRKWWADIQSAHKKEELAA